jgi:hypothetical protein
MGKRVISGLVQEVYRFMLLFSSTEKIKRTNLSVDGNV